jgi:hypothetical protein
MSKTIQDLPDKLLIEIFSHLDSESFFQLVSVCKRWNEVIENNMDYFSSFFADVEEAEEELRKGKTSEIDDDLDDLPRKSNNNNTSTTSKAIPSTCYFCVIVFFFLF